MKNWYVMLICCTCLCGMVQGQEKVWTKKNLPRDWHLRSFEKDRVYGAAVYDAYEYLKGREPKRRVVVAVIDGGMDITHEDLRESLWVNEGEIPGNGIDDDGNGYVDDVHGWNFLGTPDGGSVKTISAEADRYYMYLRERFDGVDTSRLSKREKSLYHYYVNELPKVSELADAYNIYMNVKTYSELMDGFDRRLKEMFPGVELEKEHFVALGEKLESGLEKRAFEYYLDRWKYTSRNNWEQMLNLRHTLLKTFEGRYSAKLRAYEADGRKNVGDDLNDVKDRFYGNATMTPHDHGSHVAGIIGATRDNGVGVDGVADVRLMSLRVCADGGDEYDKDVASAIRYAVENGANIINISLGRSVSMHREWLDAALRFAEKRGVLVVHAAGNNGRCTDHAYDYPTRYSSKGKAVKNLINVGNSYADGMPVMSSNFGKDEVDLFAQGGIIYSTITGNGYKDFTGTSMAAPVVAGVAALIWNYFPGLTVKELKGVLLDGVTSRRGVEVSRPAGIRVLGKEKVYFEDLCASGGILNALESVKLAEKLCENKK
ncbi:MULTISPECIES: S8 family serine peptidase [Butyricimonas]|uniref:S8 family serine peptidase n=1 Tax=Butyricimonas TaxID=574697 RepID=UPI0007FB30A4|nr:MULTISPECIES: S8 family serine peptidase [Butyricimonas]